MARRNRKIDLRLNDTEFERLNNDVQKTGLSREEYLRSLITHSPIKTMPSKNLVEVLKILQQINNSMNLLSIKASSLNLIDATAYWENVESLKNTIRKLLEVMYG
ncbi:MAG: hypothetical protein MR903_03355 [Clostridiales bacterium]|nr:hypothetical protein [Clostridiales bacterium]